MSPKLFIISALILIHVGAKTPQENTTEVSILKFDQQMMSSYLLGEKRTYGYGGYELLLSGNKYGVDLKINKPDEIEIGDSKKNKVIIKNLGDSTFKKIILKYQEWKEICEKDHVDLTKSMYSISTYNFSFDCDYLYSDPYRKPCNSKLHIVFDNYSLIFRRYCEDCTEIEINKWEMEDLYEKVISGEYDEAVEKIKSSGETWDKFKGIDE